MNKKGFGYKIWIAILISMLVVFLILGFSSIIDSVNEKQSDVVLLDFVNDLDTAVQLTTQNYGSVKFKEYYLRLNR